MAGQEGLHALETGYRARQGEEGEDVIDPVQVGAGLHHAGGEQGLDLRCEQQPFAAAVRCRVQ